MPKESYAKIWTTIGLLTLYCALNMYLYIQGSEIAFGYPNFSNVGNKSISLYAMLIFIPSFLMFLWVNFNFLEEHGPIRSWTEGFPVAFNLKLDPTSKAGKRYQYFFFLIFFVIPVILQIHSLKEFFNTPVYLKSNPQNVIAYDFKSHLLNFVPFSLSFGNKYGFGDFQDNPVTFFPGYESWTFLLLELLIVFLLIRFFIKVYNAKPDKNIKSHNPDLH